MGESTAGFFKVRLGIPSILKLVGYLFPFHQGVSHIVNFQLSVLHQKSLFTKFCL